MSQTGYFINLVVLKALYFATFGHLLVFFLLVFLLRIFIPFFEPVFQIVFCELPKIFRLKLAPQPRLWCIPHLFLCFSHIQEIHYLLIRPSALYDCLQDFILPYRIPLVQQLFQNCSCMVISFLRCDYIRFRSFNLFIQGFPVRFSCSCHLFLLLIPPFSILYSTRMHSILCDSHPVQTHLILFSD